MICYIFDFDGTLVDSYDCVIAKFNLLAQEFKFKEVQEKDIHQLKNLTSKELIQFLQIPLYKLPFVLQRARQYVQADILKLPIFPNLKEVLHELKLRKYKLGIVTSNSNITVKHWLRIHDLQSIFDFLHTETNYFGKNHILRKIAKQQKLQIENTYYIGDETRDIDAAKQAKIYSVAVAWGFNTENILKLHHPDFLIRNPNELLNIK